MSIRKLFDKKIPNTFEEATDITQLASSVESSGNVDQRLIQKDRFIPNIDFSNAGNFTKFGSAEKYYTDAMKRIYTSYPYDGSWQERTKYFNESTFLDRYIFNERYPRTNGFVDLSSNGAFWSGVTALPFTPLTIPGNYEYIEFIGGPHAAPTQYTQDPISKQFSYSNVYNTASNQESNLQMNLTGGASVEFWFKHGADFAPFGGAPGIVETLVDMVSGSILVPSRLSINIGRSALTPTLYQFNFSIQSNAAPGVSLTTALTPTSSLENWHHYAFTAINEGSGTELKFYMDGELVQTVSDPDQAAPINYISGTLGSLAMGTVPGSFKGDGKTSGSFDEFRYWKTKRTSENIGRYWFTQVAGGTNTDLANTDLGVYYKFNEGITGVSSTDSVVLDFSGRLTNGAWTGYPGSDARSTSSAMIIATASAFEYKDPIIYSFHPDVQSLYSTLESSGSAFDATNNGSLYYSLPAWIIEEDERDAGGTLLTLTQIMASYLDTLYLQIEALPNLKDPVYDRGDQEPAPFASSLLESYGLQAPEIFVDANILAQILNRDEDREFEDQLTDIKNLIYKNIYNNLIYIYKSKGTMKSLRNLIHCYGIDTDLVRINAYGNNVDYTFENNFRSTAERKKYADFNGPDRFQGTVYQQTASGNPNSTGTIGASGPFQALTAECEVIFPHKRSKFDSDWFPTPFLSSSVYGLHCVNPGSTATTWRSPDHDFQVYAIRDELESNNAYFQLTNVAGTINLTSSLFYDVYNNKKWNLAIRLQPEAYGAPEVSGTWLGSGGPGNYKLEFYGVNSEVDIVANEFYLTQSLPNEASGTFASPKRLYLGSHRTNFTGSVLESSDLKISSLRYWASHLDNETIRAHARDGSNYGSSQPQKSTYLYDLGTKGFIIPQADTLALQWDFNSVTASGPGVVPNAYDAGFAVQDLSSGSLNAFNPYPAAQTAWYGKQHTGRGDFYLADDPKVMDLRYVYSGKQNLPEAVYSSDMIDIMENEDIVFTKDSRPVDYYFQIEKSMYQTISDEMINIFATIVAFNNLIGEPVNRYRADYKKMAKLRQLFFQKVENTPSLDKYIQFYQWIDSSLNIMLQQMLAASANFSDDIRNMVESHILERNKYKTKFPTLEFVAPDLETGLNGINELLYNWKFGHAPSSSAGAPSPQDENCFWWNQRANRSESLISSGDPNVDNDRNQYLSASLQVLNRSYTTPYRFTVDESKELKGGFNDSPNKKRDFVQSTIAFGTTDGLRYFELPSGDNDSYVDCEDNTSLRWPAKYYGLGIAKYPPEPYTKGNWAIFAPFDVYKWAPNTEGKFENYHQDSYGPVFEVPAQGPFTNYAVGGLQYRHNPLNAGADTQVTRMEGFTVTPSNYLEYPNVHHARGIYYRDETAKRPVNIKNIHHTTGSTQLGNYDEIYDLVQTCGRYTNNQAFIKSGGFDLEPPYIYSDWVYDMGAVQYAKIQRGRTPHVFVNRFSAPGGPETAGDSNGGPGLDRYSAEFSAYNDTNYRNSTVRDVLVKLQTSHVGQFGYFTNTQQINGLPGSEVNAFNYAGTGSIYQVNRNPIQQPKYSGSGDICSTIYDNYYIQHPIPRTDLQYAWITASTNPITTCNALNTAYFPYSGMEGNVPVGDFVSQSQYVGTWISNSAGLGPIIGWYGIDKDRLPYSFFSFDYTYFIPTVFNGLNYTLVDNFEPETASTLFSKTQRLTAQYGNEALFSFLGGYTAGNFQAAVLNSLILKRQGPYGWPTWKQIRGFENPMVRYYRKNNIITCNSVPGPTRLFNDGQRMVTDRFGSLGLYIEPAVTSQCSVIEHTLGIRTVVDTASPPYSTIEAVTLQSTMGNNLSLFSNNELNFCSDIGTCNEQAYDTIKNLYLNGALNQPSNPIYSFVQLVYKERVYPATKNATQKMTRQRTGYETDYWKAARASRTLLGTTKWGGS